jgi:type IV pilus assembly protein PilA
MKTELQAKYLQHLLSKKKGNEGFTLIELLVVIIIIGILAAIALPSFLNQANKARESEAKTYVGSINRAQQAYFLEQTTFGANLTALELGISDSVSYAYTTAGTATNAPTTAKAVNTALNSYSGIVWLGKGGDGVNTTLAKLCNKTATPATNCT